MPDRRPDNPQRGLSQPFLLVSAVALAVVVFAITYIGMRESRADSFKLLVQQGTAFTETLAHAADNAMASESFVDYVVYRRYGEIVTTLTAVGESRMNPEFLSKVAYEHDLLGLYLIDSLGNPAVSGVARQLRAEPPDFVVAEAAQLLARPEAQFSLLLDTESGAEGVLYYLEIANDLSRVFVVADESAYYTDGLEQMQIGYLAQEISRERGVVYVLYHTTEGIVFASRKTGPLLSIESDDFLSRAIEQDTISHREIEFEGRTVLELVRPFSTTEYPLGLLRVGLSLDAYYQVTRGFDLQMIALSGVLFTLLLVFLLYMNSRSKRRELTRRYQQMKSVTDRIFDEMQTGVAAIDSSGQVSLANAAFERILGCGSAVGRRWQDIVPDKELVADAGNVAGETEVSVRVGSMDRTLLVASSPLDPGQPGGSERVLVVYDITRLREFERKSARRERLSELGNLAAGVAHEIRNPLNAISIAAQRLASEYVPDTGKDQFLQFTKQIRSETKRLNDIITRFLALAREGAPSEEQINVGDLIGELAALWQLVAEKVAISLSVEVQDDCIVSASADRLKDAFNNLFANAKEAIGEQGGSVRVVVSRDESMCEVVVADDGPGIDEAQRDRIFTPYYTTKEAGTGLGLPTVHRIVTDLGGEVSARDAAGGGAEFVVRLPLAHND